MIFIYGVITRVATLYPTPFLHFPGNIFAIRTPFLELQKLYVR